MTQARAVNDPHLSSSNSRLTWLTGAPVKLELMESTSCLIDSWATPPGIRSPYPERTVSWASICLRKSPLVERVARPAGVVGEPTRWITGGPPWARRWIMALTAALPAALWRATKSSIMPGWADEEFGIREGPRCAADLRAPVGASKR